MKNKTPNNINKEKWGTSKETCPLCNGKTEMLIRLEDGIEYESKERCPKCRWVVDFEAEKIEAKRY